MKNTGVSYKNAQRLAGELSIVRVLNDFQPLSVLRVN
ncbi:capsid protein [Escherichia ruysiae]|nr:capsid protein [Escherichia ruysiae]